MSCSDNVKVPTRDGLDSDSRAVYCSGCAVYLGGRGCGEILEHSITDCLQELLRRLEKLESQ